MAIFEYAYDLAGNTYPVKKSFDIAASTNVKKGEVVALSGGKIVAAGTTPSAILGITAVSHNGTTETDTRIEVYCSSTAVYKVKAPSITASSDGSTTTFVSTDLGTIANDGLNGGYLKFKTVTNTAILNNVVPITDFVTSTGVTTVPTLAATTKSGDIVKVFPPVGSTGWKPNANDLTINATGGTAIQIIDTDTKLEYIYFKIASQLI